MQDNNQNGVCAVIVTFNRKATLRRCLEHVRALTERPQRVLVVDNASTDGTADMVRADFPEFDLLTLSANNGGAGGFDAGMREAYASGFEFVWLFDDDAYAHPDCLRHLLAAAPYADVLLAVQVDQAGRRYGLYSWREHKVRPVEESDVSGDDVDIFTFVGPLIKRHVIAQIGWPRVDYFICADDLEFSLRVQNAGFRSLRVRDAFFWHDYGGTTRTVKRFGRSAVRSDEPAWRNYYSTRNDILTARSASVPRARRREFWTYVARKTAHLSLREALYERDFPARWRFTLLGAFDGLLGRSGKRVAPSIRQLRRS